MNGTGINSPSYLPTLYGVGPGGDSLLAALCRRESAPIATDPVGVLDQALRSEGEQIARTAAQPEVRRDLARFARALARAATPAELLTNPAALKVLLTAHGLGDQCANRALAAKVLLPDPVAPGALAGRLADGRWRSLARTCAFAARGLAALREPRMAETIAQGYAEAVWRHDQERATPGLGTALAFLRRAPAVVWVRQVQGDPALDAVIALALDIPPESAFPTAAARDTAIAARLDVARLRDPRYVRQLAEIYLGARAAEAGLAA